MSNGFGILAAIAAALAFGASKTARQPESGQGTFPGGTTPGGAPLNQWKEPTGTTSPTLRPTGAIAIDIPAPGSSMPEPTNPAPMIPVSTPTPAPRKRTWFISPNEPIQGREPTPEEEQSGLGCPEIPGIWDAAKMNPPAKFCANPECPSNKNEIDPYTGNVIPATPARLNIIVIKATGAWEYTCPVCGVVQ